jgi:hypothetical protein
VVGATVVVGARVVIAADASDPVDSAVPAHAAAMSATPATTMKNLGIGLTPLVSAISSMRQDRFLR